MNFDDFKAQHQRALEQVAKEYEEYEKEIMRYEAQTNKSSKTKNSFGFVFTLKDSNTSTYFSILYQILSNSIGLTDYEIRFNEFKYLKSLKSRDSILESNNSNSDDEALLFIVKSACDGVVITDIQRQIYPSLDAIKKSLYLMSSRWPLICKFTYDYEASDSYFKLIHLSKPSITLHSLEHDFISKLRDKRFRYFLSFAITVIRSSEHLIDEIKNLINYEIKLKLKQNENDNDEIAKAVESSNEELTLSECSANTIASIAAINRFRTAIETNDEFANELRLDSYADGPERSELDDEIQEIKGMNHSSISLLAPPIFCNFNILNSIDFINRNFLTNVSEVNLDDDEYKQTQVYLFHCFRDIDIYTRLINRVIANTSKIDVSAEKTELEELYRAYPCCDVILDLMRREFNDLAELD